MDSYWYVPSKNRHGLRISKLNKYFAQMMRRRRVESEGQRQDDGTVVKSVGAKRGTFRDGVYVKEEPTGAVLPRKNAYDRELSDAEFVRFMEERQRQMTQVGMVHSGRLGEDDAVDSDVDTHGTAGEDEEAVDGADEDDEQETEAGVRYDIAGETGTVKVADRVKADGVHPVSDWSRRE